MDTLYIGDIPQEYCYAVFGDGYIDLYNTQNITPNLMFYRVYMYDNYFAYDHFINTTTTTTGKYINVSDYHMYRRDLADITIITGSIILLLVFLVNLVTSVFKKGGMLSGLL